MLFCGGDFLA
jgi:hypothetical protein